MKCVCKRCYKVVELLEPKYSSMTDSFWEVYVRIVKYMVLCMNYQILLNLEIN